MGRGGEGGVSCMQYAKEKNNPVGSMIIDTGLAEDQPPWCARAED